MTDLREEQIAVMAKAMQQSAAWPAVFKADAARVLAEAAFDVAGTVFVTRDYLGCTYQSRDIGQIDAIQAGSLDSYRRSLIEDAARAYEAHDTTDRDWVNGSLWDKLNQEGAARVRKLVDPAKDGPAMQPPAIILPAPTMSREQARGSGYTGDSCTYCQGMQVKRNGSCLVCETCGNTTGCS